LFLCSHGDYNLGYDDIHDIHDIDVINIINVSCIYNLNSTNMCPNTL
jgi:hypothetical protein